MKMKSRLKDYFVTVEYSHESARGYDHNDGSKIFEVKAINKRVAGKKGMKLANKTRGGYGIKLKEVQNQNDETDCVYYS